MSDAIQHSPFKEYAYLHHLCTSSHESDHQFFRLYFVTNSYKPRELASFLGVSGKDVIRAQKDAQEGGGIPEEWLLCVLHAKNVHPDWILKGRGNVDWECVFHESCA